MAHWIFIEEGTYRAESAFLMTPDFHAVALEEPVMEVYRDGRQERRVQGHGLIYSLLMVELLEDHDEIDLVVDLADEFKYFLKSPSIRAGKVFSPDVRTLLHFVARQPLQKLSGDEYQLMKSRLSIIRPRGSI